MTRSSALRKDLIAVSDAGARFNKLVRLALSRDGSFSVLVPYHPAKTGVLVKMRMPGVMTGPGKGVAAIEEACRADVPVKLSIHSSGFVQFSSAGTGRVKSGRSADFAVPKGLGLHSAPITSPIDTGPTWMAAFFDPGSCAQLGPTSGVHVLRFTEEDFFDRDPHDFASSHVLMIEGFVFPADVRRDAIYHPTKGWVVRRAYAPSRPEWMVDFRIVDLPSPVAVLGILVSRSHMPLHSRVGYSLQSPRDLTGQFELVAFYPAEAGGSSIEGLANIEYQPDT